MESLLRFGRKVRFLLSRERFNDDLAEEMAFHQDQTQRRLEADGMSPDAAKYAAARQFGNPVRLKERSHETVGFRFETTIQDGRYAIRQLRKNPGFSLTAILILALGIGASTAIFSAVNPILFKSLPYPHPDRLVTVLESRSGGGSGLPNFGLFRGLTEQRGPFEAAAVFKAWQPAVTGLDQPERLEGQRVSSEYFRALGVLPALGRDFLPTDDQYKGPNVVILSDRMWRHRFNADPAIIGRKITLEMTAYQLVLNDLFTVVGVMPANFENVVAPEAELWAPLQYDPALLVNSKEWGHHLQMVARLKPGISRAQAASWLDTLLPTLGQRYAKGFESGGGVPKSLIVGSMHDELIASVRPALLAIVGAVILVLMIACVNVTNLLLGRGAQRRGEFAMRAALGAGPRRLVRQLLTESLGLALIGGIFGLAVAELGVKALVALSPAELPRAGEIHIDTAVFLFALIVTSLVGLVVGLMPALHASRSDPHSALQQNSRTSSGGQQLARHWLVISEVSLALVLLVSAGLLFRSLQRLFSIDPGFDASHVLTMQVQESGGRYGFDDARARFFEQALENVQHVPGVLSAAFTSQLPLSGDYESYGIEFEAYPHDNDVGFRYGVSPSYFETMHIPLLRGRLVNENDRRGAPVAVLISESLAKRRFHDRDPLGQRVRIGPGMGDPKHAWATIVGVVGDVKQLSLATNEPDAFYTRNVQWDWVDSTESLVVRARGDAATLAPALRAAIWSVDKDQPIVRVATMESLVITSEAQRRFALILFEAFALVALLLAATGLYGVLSGSVTERTREIGVRTALGASRHDILTLIVKQGMKLCALGIVIGLIGAAAASRALLTLLFGISPVDLVTYLGVMALLAIISAVACWVPAWRAAHVDPAITLRAE